jgi:hypothetical protein
MSEGTYVTGRNSTTDMHAQLHLAFWVKRRLTAPSADSAYGYTARLRILGRSVRYGSGNKSRTFVPVDQKSKWFLHSGSSSALGEASGQEVGLL